MDHDTLRHLADTWGLLLLVGIFVAAVCVAFRPGSAAYYKKCAEIPLDDDRETDR
ncbi:MAG: cbb3-type cytochrome c oxidase subunit 3 [Alphaproteobacteria bacterium]